MHLRSAFVGTDWPEILADRVELLAILPNWVRVPPSMQQSNQPTLPLRTPLQVRSAVENDAFRVLEELRRRALLESNKMAELLTTIVPQAHKDARIHRSN